MVLIRPSDTKTQTAKIATTLEAENKTFHIVGFRGQGVAHLREAESGRPIAGELIEFWLNGSDTHVVDVRTDAAGKAVAESGGHISRLQESIQGWQEGYTVKYRGSDKYLPAPDAIGNVNLIPGL